MKPFVIQMLEARGLAIDESKYEAMEGLWNFIETKKREFDRSQLQESDISLKTTAGGDHVE